MADISAIKPTGASGASYNIKDATARTNIGTLSNNVSALGGRVTSLETDMQAVENNIQRTYFSDGYNSDDPEGDYGFTDCSYVIVVDATKWIYDDNDQVIQKTYKDTYSYINNIEDEAHRVGTPKVGDIIFVKLGNSTEVYGTLPTDEVIGKFNTSSLDSHYAPIEGPPVSSDDINVNGSGSFIHFGTTYYMNYKAFYIVGLATVNVPSEDVEGKTDTLLLAKCFATEW